MVKKLLMISTDRQIFEVGSAVRARQVEYAKGFDEVHIVVFTKKGTAGRAEAAIAPNCWAYPTRSSSKFLYPFDAIKLGRFIIDKRGVTEITCQDASLAAMAGVSLKKEFAALGRPLSLEIQVHEDLGSPYYGRMVTNKIRKSLALKYLPQADRIRVVSGRIKDFIVKSLDVPESKIEVRPIAVNVERIKNASILVGADLHTKYPQFKKIVLMASRLEPEKNIELAIKAFKYVSIKIPTAGLIIVGKGSRLDGLKALVSQSHLNRSVVFEDWADQATLASYYKTADLFLNTSFFEGYGMTLVEAQAAGVPIVSTDVGVAREVGATIIPFEPSKVAEAIIASLRATV